MSETQTLLKITQQKLPASQLGLEIEIPGERSQRAYESVVTKLMKTAQIPGFRRGKIPRQVIMQRFGAGYVKAATLEDLVQEMLNEAIKQEDLQVLGNLELQSSFEDLVEQFTPGESLIFSAKADVPPEVVLNRYSDFEVEVEKTLYDPARVDETLKQQQSAHATLVPIDDRPAQKDDVVMVDFVSTFPDEEDSEDGEDSGSEMTDFQVELSEDRFLPGFVQGVIGMSIDETKEFDVEFPEDYFEKSLGGRTATFKVTLKDIKSKELPELTDDFAQEISEFQTLQELRDFLEEQYQQESETENKNRTNASIVESLVQELNVDLPKTLIDQEVNYLLNEMAARFQSQGMDISKLFTKESIPGFQERLRPDAETRVKRTLALAEVAKQESIEVSAEALEEKFVETLKQVDESKIDRDRLKKVLEEELLEEAVLTWVKEHSKITLVDAPPETDLSVKKAPEEETPKKSDKKTAKKESTKKANSEGDSPKTADSSDQPDQATQELDEVEKAKVPSKDKATPAKSPKSAKSSSKSKEE